MCCGLFLGVFLTAAGCLKDDRRPQVHPAHGKVLVNGEPAEGALIALHPADGRKVDESGTIPSGHVGADGGFTLSTYTPDDGAPVGDYVVSIIWFPNPTATPPGPDRLAGKFADPAKSDLKVTIHEGENALKPFEIKMSAPTARPRRSSRAMEPRE
jgi:hypothetical protein